MRIIIRKSLLTSLCQREEFPLIKGGLRGLFTPLWKRGARGDFPIKCAFIYEILLKGF